MSISELKEVDSFVRGKELARGRALISIVWRDALEDIGLSQPVNGLSFGLDWVLRVPSTIVLVNNRSLKGFCGHVNFTRRVFHRHIGGSRGPFHRRTAASGIPGD